MILSLISGGIKTVCTSHTSGDKCSKENYSTRHKSLTKHFSGSLFILFCSLLLPSSILDCLIPDCLHDHKTFNTRLTDKGYTLLEVRTKKGPFVRRGAIMFLISLQYDFCCWLFFRWSSHLLVLKYLFWVKQWCSNVRHKFSLANIRWNSEHKMIPLP